jgi:hypothetical protein
MKTKKLHKLKEDKIDDEWYVAEESTFNTVGKAGLGCVYAFLTFFIAIIATILILIF